MKTAAPVSFHSAHRQSVVALVKLEKEAYLHLRNVIRTADGHLLTLIQYKDEAGIFKAIQKAAKSLQEELSEAILDVRAESRKESHQRLLDEIDSLRDEVDDEDIEDPEIDHWTHRDVVHAQSASASFVSAWMAAVVAAIVKAFNEGEDIGLAAGLASRRLDSRVARIARTEVSRAFNNSRADAGDDFAEKHKDTDWVPLVFKRWDAVLDSKVCQTCRDMDGDYVPIGTSFRGGDAPGDVHPNCVLPETLIQTVSGVKRIDTIRVGDMVIGGISGKPRTVTFFHRNPFLGSVVRISYISGSIVVTNNHPILTANGWINAIDVKPGDKIFRYIDQASPISNRIPHPAKDPPARANKEAVFCGVDLGFSDSFMPVSGINLNNQFGFYEGKIGVIDSNLEMWSWRKTCSNKLSHEHSLNAAKTSSVGDRSGMLEFEEMGFGPSPDRRVGRHGQSFSANYTFPSHSDDIRFRSSSDTETKFDQKSANNAPRHTEDLRHSHHRSFGLVKDSKFLHIDSESCGHEHVVACHPYYATTVSSTSIQQFGGDVFNLTVDGDESYVASGIVVHNCRCIETLVYLPAPISMERTGS